MNDVNILWVLWCSTNQISI